MSENNDVLSAVLSNPDHHRLQIIYTQVDRDADNNPSFRTFTYRHRPDEYYYPASTIKLPAALLALEKINSLDVSRLTAETHLSVDSVFSGQSSEYEDSSSDDGYPTLGHYIHKVLIVSDNNAYNRLYEFLGQKYLNQQLWDKSYNSARFVHRLSVPLTAEENSHTNPILFFEGSDTVYFQDQQVNNFTYNLPANDYILGKGELRGNDVVMEPKNFREKNFISMMDYHRLMQALIYPEAVPQENRFNLREEDYERIYHSMSMLPGESKYPAYDSDHFWDSYVKFFMFGNSKKPIPESIRIFNKVGQAYGFLIDHSYIVDFENKVEFFLSAVIYVNENEILNDGVYEYDSTGFPFLHELGQAVYQHELKRERLFLPDLSKFQLEY